MNGNEKRNKGLTFAAAIIIGASFLVSAQDGMPAGQTQPQVQQQPTQAQQANPIYESEKAWKFDDDNLIFFNPSQNAGGIRYFYWKDYTWAVTQTQIVCMDQRPYGTQLQGLRNQMTKDGPQSDKDLMNDLKRQAGDIRKSRDPNSGSLPISIGLGLGFDFSRSHHGGHHGHHHP